MAGALVIKVTEMKKLKRGQVIFIIKEESRSKNEKGITFHRSNS